MVEKSKRRNECVISPFREGADKKVEGKKKTGLYEEDRPSQAFNGKSNNVNILFSPLR